LPFASRCLDHTRGPCRIGLEARIPQRFTEGMSLCRICQRLSECSHEVIIDTPHPVRLAEPPSLRGALQEGHGVLAVLKSMQVLARPKPIPRQHVIRFTHGRIIAAVPSFFQRTLGTLRRPL